VKVGVFVEAGSTAAALIVVAAIMVSVAIMVAILAIPVGAHLDGGNAVVPSVAGRDFVAP
jgi:hypothetical protein